MGFSRQVDLRGNRGEGNANHGQLLSQFMPVLVTKAILRLSGDHEGTLIVPWPPQAWVITLAEPRPTKRRGRARGQGE